MRSKNLSPECREVYQRCLQVFYAEMDNHELTRQERLEVLSMACADTARGEGPECLDFIERTFQCWIEDMQHKDDA